MSDKKSPYVFIDRKTVTTVTSTSNAYIERITTDTGKEIATQIKQGNNPPKERSK